MGSDFCMRRFTVLCLLCLCALAPVNVAIAGGPFGIDHRIAYDNGGIWQSDVLVGWALGAAVGIWAAHRKSPLILGWLPHGFEVGFVHRF